MNCAVGVLQWVRSNGKDGSVMTYPGDGRELTEDPVLWKGRRGYHVLYHTERAAGGSLTYGNFDIILDHL